MVGYLRLSAELTQLLRGAPGGCLGLHGGAGLGKSTLARALCAYLQESFARICLLSCIGPEQQAAGHPGIIQQALRQLGARQLPGTSREQVSVPCTTPVSCSTSVS